MRHERETEQVQEHSHADGTKAEASASELLVALILDGLRPRDGCMSIHRRVLEHSSSFSH